LTRVSLRIAGLSLGGRDLRQKPLIERKQILRTLVPAQPSRLLYVENLLFRAACTERYAGQRQFLQERMT
jgi:ATP-dependent DNA ligase